MESELDGMHTNISNNAKEIHGKVGAEEMARVWAHFQRFAEYKDLKHLHGMVIPEIANFELKI